VIRQASRLLLSTLVVMVLNAFGWLRLQSDGHDSRELNWKIFGTALVVAICFAVGSYVFWKAWRYIFKVPLGNPVVTVRLALVPYLLWPFVGWALLSLTALALPGMIQLNGFLLTVLCGLLLTICWINVNITASRRH